MKYSTNKPIARQVAHTSHHTLTNTYTIHTLSPIDPWWEGTRHAIVHTTSPNTSEHRRNNKMISVSNSWLCCSSKLIQSDHFCFACTCTHLTLKISSGNVGIPLLNHEGLHLLPLRMEGRENHQKGSADIITSTVNNFSITTIQTLNLASTTVKGTN